jgi:O-antigen/teichoic acid export membrane protein
MKKNLLKDISASTFQVVLNQALGLLIFIIISRYLAKPVYGEFNWSLAILTFITTLLSLRLEQIVVQKIAAGDSPSKLLTLFTAHTIFSGLLFYALLFIASLLFPAYFTQHGLLLVLAISQLLSFFSSPFKQVVNGKEYFRLLAIMSSVSNIVRSVWLLYIIIYTTLTIQQLILIYIVAAFAELVIGISIVVFGLKIPVSLNWGIKDYFALLRDSLPQIGSVFLNACIARFDWILLGIFSSTIITAEYSFAYKAFELCPLPMLILGPILISRFSRYFSTHAEESLNEKKTEISFFIRYAMIAATLLPLIMNIAWAPLVDTLTNNKYGAVNRSTFFLLSLCLPFQYMVNLLWSMQFAQNRLKHIFRVTAITCIIIVAGDLLMIPLLNAKGAAIVYLLATSVEYVIYLRSSLLIRIKESWQSVIICMCIALLSGVLGELCNESLMLKIVIASVFYLSMLLITGQVKRKDWQIIKLWI